MDTNWTLVIFLVAIVGAEFSTYPGAAFPPRSLREIASKRRQLHYIKNLLQDLDSRLERLQKRSCMLNLPGMDCEYGDISGSGKDQDFWSSRMAPGKRRDERSIRQTLQ